MIQPVPEWDILDSSKIKTAMMCMRHYLYRYIFGWQEDRPALDLIFGTAWHRAMAHIYCNGVDYSVSRLADAYQTFEEEYRQHYSPLDDDGNRPKMPGNALRAIGQYAKTYRLDDFDVLHIEVAGQVYIDEAGECPMAFRIDLVIRTLEGIFIMDHKTAGRMPTEGARAQWHLDAAFGTYQHAVCCLPDIDPAEMKGTIVNVFTVHDPPRMTKAGVPYANAKDNEFLRINLPMTPTSMSIWHDYVLPRYQQLRALTDDLKCYKPQPRKWPMNATACGAYRGCPYQLMCRTWTNPFNHADEPPPGFTVSHWNPLSEALLSARAVFDPSTKTVKEVTQDA